MIDDRTPQARLVNVDDGEVRAWATLVEIDENLIRRDLTPAQRAKLVAQRKRAYEDVNPGTKQGGAPGKAGGGKAKTANLAGFAQDTSSKTGKPLRSVERDITRGRKLGDDLDRVTGTSLDKGAELDALAAMPPEQRATRRLDQLRQAQKETVGLNAGSPGPGRGKAGFPSNPAFDVRPTLASQGIDKNLAHQARTLGALSEDIACDAERPQDRRSEPSVMAERFWKSFRFVISLVKA